MDANASAVDLDPIGDQTGKPALVATMFVITTRPTTRPGRSRSARSRNFAFENEFGQWVVTAYNVEVQRSVGVTTAAKTASTGERVVNGAEL